MNFKEYQEKALRTAGSLKNIEDRLISGGLGISGEAGEVTDYIKKVLYHGHKFDPVKLALELGDVLWYVSLLSDATGIDLNDIAAMNIMKLKKRYPDGFDIKKSINRQEYAEEDLIEDSEFCEKATEEIKLCGLTNQECCVCDGKEDECENRKTEYIIKDATEKEANAGNKLLEFLGIPEEKE